MKTHRIVSTVTLAALFASFVPTSALAADDRKPADPASVAETTAPPMIPAAFALSKSSIARAVGSVKPATPAPSRTTSSASMTRVKQGGGKTAMVMTLVMTAVGVGTSYYLIKEMNKEMQKANDAATQAHR